MKLISWKEPGFSSNSIRFCRLLLGAKGLEADPRLPAATCHGLTPAPVALILNQPPPPPSRWLLIINEGQDNISAQGLGLLRHSCGWISAQIQSCRSFWRCQSPQTPPGRSAVLRASSVGLVGHGRCAPGTRKAIIYRSENAEKGGNVNTELL